MFVSFSSHGRSFKNPGIYDKQGTKQAKVRKPWPHLDLQETYVWRIIVASCRVWHVKKFCRNIATAKYMPFCGMYHKIPRFKRWNKPLFLQVLSWMILIILCVLCDEKIFLFTMGLVLYVVGGIVCCGRVWACACMHEIWMRWYEKFIKFHNYAVKNRQNFLEVITQLKHY